MNLKPEIVCLGDHEYMVGRLDMFDAMHVARLISPLLPAFFSQIFTRIIDLLSKSKDENGATPEEIFSEIGEVVALCEPILYRLSKMSREDFESVIKTCLSCVERKSGKGYARVMIDGNLMFADMEMGEALRLTTAVIARELRPTIAGLLKSVGSPATSPAS